MNVFPSCKGGDTCVNGGYIYEYLPGHPLCSNWGWVLQHRLIAEDTLGRPLVQHQNRSLSETVHHRDHCPLNNHPDNLQVMSYREHMQYHGRLSGVRTRSQITQEQVIDALKDRSVIDAAKLLGVHQMTLRNRFPELVMTRKRKTPTVLSDPEIVARVVQMAKDPAYDIRDAAKATGMSPLSIQVICRRHRVDWVARTAVRMGVSKRQYRRKATSLHEQPEKVEEAMAYAADPTVSRTDAAATMKVSPATLDRILVLHQIPWTPVARKGEVRKQYRKKPTRQQSEAHAPATESDLL